jgi:hypothetical protein
METIKNLDIFGIKPSIYINSKTKFKNSVGGTITLITIFVILIISSFIIYEWTSRNNLRYISDEVENLKSTFNITRYPIVLHILDNTENGFEDFDRIFSFEANLHYEEICRIGKCNRTKTSKKIGIERCNKLSNIKNKFNEKSLNVFGLYYKDSDKCIDLSEETILVKEIQNTIRESKIEINLLKCQNSTLNNNNCLSIEEINSMINDFKIILRFPDFHLNDKLEVYMKEQIINISPDFQNIYENIFQEINTIDNSNLFLNNFIKSKIYKLNDKESIRINNNNNNITNLLKVNFSISNKKINFTITSDKICSLYLLLYVIILSIFYISGFINNILCKDFFINYICNYNKIFDKLDQQELNNHSIKKKPYKIKNKNFSFSVNSPSENLNYFSSEIDEENKEYKLNSNFSSIKNSLSKEEIEIEKGIDKISDGNFSENCNNNSNNNINNDFLNIKTNNEGLPNKFKVKSVSKFKTENNKDLEDKEFFNRNNSSNLNPESSQFNFKNFINEENDFDKLDNYKDLNINNNNFKNDDNINFNENNLNNNINENNNYNNSSSEEKNEQINVKKKSHFVENSKSILKKRREGIDTKTKSKCDTENNFNFKFNFNLFESCQSLYLKKTGKLKVFYLAKKYYKRKMSIEEILKKIIEIDIIKFLTIDSKILNDFNHISKPDIFFKINNKNTKYELDALILNKELIFDEAFMDRFWLKYEFNDSFKKEIERKAELFDI